MLKRKYRLSIRAKLARTSSYKSQSIRLMITPNQLSFSRFGFIISKKIDKRAVVRNRTKRVVRSCIEELREKIIKGYDMIFILQKSAVGQKRKAAYSEIEKLLLSNKLIKRKP